MNTTPENTAVEKAMRQRPVHPVRIFNPTLTGPTSVLPRPRKLQLLALVVHFLSRNRINTARIPSSAVGVERTFGSLERLSDIRNASAAYFQLQIATHVIELYECRP
jgi:hypothetical protein